MPGKMPKPTEKQRRALKKLQAYADAFLDARSVALKRETELWRAMERTRKAGATLGQIQQAILITFPEGGDMGPLYSRARVQQLVDGIHSAS